MKKVLTDAPLVQALIDLRFSEIPSLSSIPADVINKIHEAMIGVGFAEKIESKGQSVSIRFDQATQQATQEITPVNRYLFRAAGERSIIELSKSSLIYKSTEYGTFEDFYKKFDEVLSSLIELVPTLNKSLLKRVGLRYIDVIVPDSGNTLEDFISDGLLAPKLNEPIDGCKHIHGLTSKVVEVNQNKMLRVALEELPVENRSIRKILPDFHQHHLLHVRSLRRHHQRRAPRRRPPRDRARRLRRLRHHRQVLCSHPQRHLRHHRFPPSTT